MTKKMTDEELRALPLKDFLKLLEERMKEASALLKEWKRKKLEKIKDVQ